MQLPEQIKLNGDGIFPNSNLPVLLYKGALQIPVLFPAGHIMKRFDENNWKNAWDSGIFKYHHYHSISHEVLGIYRGKTILKLGGEHGVEIRIEKGDVLVIPAGVAHKNLGGADDIGCVGAYPGGRNYDMNYGTAGERPAADNNIAAVPLPATDPLYGAGEGLPKIWSQYAKTIS